MDVRDVGLFESVLARPRASAFGSDAYRELHTKAAALVDFVAGDHGLVDGTAQRWRADGHHRLPRDDGWRLTLTNDEAYDSSWRVATRGSG